MFKHIAYGMSVTVWSSTSLGVCVCVMWIDVQTQDEEVQIAASEGLGRCV